MPTKYDCPCSLETPLAVLTAEVETIKREQAQSREDFRKLIWAILYAALTSTGTLLLMLLKR